jgi:hypothetical protein
VSEPNWQPIATMPEGRPVLTRILDADGERNVQVLTRRGRLYWIGGSMYVYYQPTHWADGAAAVSDLRSGPLQHALNNADNGGESSRQEAMVLLYEHRWELHDALDALESLMVDLGLYSLSTRQAAKTIPSLVREIMQGTVNGRLLHRAFQAEQALSAASAPADPKEQQP